jgi:hypothetical protein
MLRMEATPHTSVTNATGAFDSLLALSGSLLILAWHGHLLRTAAACAFSYARIDQPE